MEVKHAHIELAEAQRVQKTLLAPGPCPHMFYGVKENRRVYGRVTKGEEYEYYEKLLALTNLKNKTSRRIKAELMAAAEIYTKRIIQIWVEICGLRTFKDQDGVYQGWGPPGDFMMMRVGDFVRELEKKYGRIIMQHDCKRGDLGATMIGYYDRFIGSLWDKLAIKHSYLKYDTMNIQVYMGKDVALLDEVKKKNYIPAQGLKLMREKGKGIIIVDVTSNDTGPEYQEQFIPERGKTLQECVAEDVGSWTIQYGLINDELSPLGLVTGCTRRSTGRIRALCPTGTFWDPGFGNQGGKFENVMLDLIRIGKWNGQGAIFIDETSKMYCFEKKFGGTGKVADMEKCALRAVNKFRELEYEAYQAPEVKDAGIRYPF
ncbi:hypothetical protein HY797_03945 [Candidatus Falkowbacteria bacterium]|nr:hypothetical protein [Candidatus Falkowbacteria bacterium]